MSEPRDRYRALIASTSLNGIDFVELVASRTLNVHYLNAVPVAAGNVVASISGGDSIPSVLVRPIAAADWSTDTDARPLLTLRTLSDGDFSDYRLTLTGAPALDALYASANFSLKAFCPSDFDCASDAPSCPPDDVPPPPIDYLAKDFASFRRALLDCSALRYPAWQERSEADAGMVVLEALAAVADELSYLQDRVAAEAALETATQRRSLVSLAR